MTTTSKIIVLYASEYRIPDDKGGISEGITMNYIYGDNLTAVKNANGSLGQRLAKASLPITNMYKFEVVPALYEGTFEMSIGSDMKASLKLVDVKYLNTVSVVSPKESTSKTA